MDLTVLDALRGLAALYVMLGHAAGLLWAGPGEAHGLAALPGLLAHHVFRWGHQAVLLFFLISGFCIHFRQAKLLAGRSRAAATATPGRLFDARSYAWRRFRRIYPTLLVALALTAAFDFVGARVNPDLYAGTTPYQVINEHIGAASHSLGTLAGNLLMQASFSVAPFGTNGPLWSLSFEAWFYVLYPALLWLTWRAGAGRMMAITSGISAVALALLPAHYPLPGGALVAAAAPQARLPLVPWWIVLVLTYWAVWAGGALIAEAYAGRARLRWLAPLAVVGVTLVASVAKEYRFVTAHAAWWQASSDLVFGLGFGLVLAWALLASPDWLRRATEAGARRLSFLGDISYSLYAVHLPWLTFFSAWWLRNHALPTGGGLAAAGAASSLVLAGGCWYLVERHVATRATARQRIVPPQPAPAPALAVVTTQRAA